MISGLRSITAPQDVQLLNWKCGFAISLGERSLLAGVSPTASKNVKTGNWITIVSFPVLFALELLQLASSSKLQCVHCGGFTLSESEQPGDKCQHTPTKLFSLFTRRTKFKATSEASRTRPRNVPLHRILSVLLSSFLLQPVPPSGKVQMSRSRITSRLMEECASDHWKKKKKRKVLHNSERRHSLKSRTQVIRPNFGQNGVFF